MKKLQAGGVSHKEQKAPKKKGAFIAVQDRTLAKAKKSSCMKCGGKVKKK